MIRILQISGEQHDWRLQNLGLSFYSFDVPDLNYWIQLNDRYLERIFFMVEVANWGHFPRRGLWGCGSLRLLEIVNLVTRRPAFDCFLHLPIERLALYIHGNPDETSEILFRLRASLWKVTFTIPYPGAVSHIGTLLDHLYNRIQAESNPKEVPFELSRFYWLELSLPENDDVPRFLDVFPQLEIFSPRVFDLSNSFDLARKFMELYNNSSDKRSFRLIGAKVVMSRETLMALMNTNFDPRTFEWDFVYSTPLTRSRRLPNGEYEQIVSKNPPSIKEILIERGNALFTIVVYPYSY